MSSCSAAFATNGVRNVSRKIKLGFLVVGCSIWKKVPNAELDMVDGLA